MSLIDAQARYGEIQNRTWGGESKWCSIWQIPDDLKLSLQGWINTATGLPVGRIYCNRDMQPALEAALRDLVDFGLADQLHTFDGCFYIRDTRGLPGQLSAHSYAGAIDLNAKTNLLGTPGDLSKELVACFTSAGFVWGGTFKRRDPMHFSFLGW